MSGKTLIGVCGIACAECGAHLATKNNDEALRRKTAEEWSKIYGVDIKPEAIDCVGCTTTTGKHFHHFTVCEIRACGQAKKVTNCGRCPDYACETINGFFKMAPAAKAVLDAEHKAKNPMRRNSLIAVFVLGALAITLGAMCAKHGNRKDYVVQSLNDNFVAGNLNVDERYQRSITFTGLGLSIPIRRENVFVRIDDPVDDVAEHQIRLHKELGYSPRSIKLSNPAQYGREMFLAFGDGKRCAFIWVKKDPNEIVTQGSIEHEKYHALCAIAREDIPLVSNRLQHLGFHVDLRDYDEELAASIIEIVSIHLRGVPLRMLSGTELVVRARDILISNAATPAPEAILVSGPFGGSGPSRLRLGRVQPPASKPEPESPGKTTVTLSGGGAGLT